MQAKQAMSLSKVQQPNQHIGQDPDAGLPAGEAALTSEDNLALMT